jgi:hypothetical protein
MQKLDASLLAEVGLAELPVDEQNKMLAHIYETLEGRVGVLLAAKITNEQLDDLQRFIDAGDEARALAWLQTNIPDYQDTVSACLADIKVEIKLVAGQIIAAATA